VKLAIERFFIEKEHGDHPSSMQPVPEHFKRIPSSSSRYMPIKPVVSGGL